MVTFYGHRSSAGGIYIIHQRDLVKECVSFIVPRWSVGLGLRIKEFINCQAYIFCNLP